MTLYQQMGNDSEQFAPPTTYVPARVTQVIPTYSRPPRREPIVSWVPSLLIACLALGFLGQMVHQEADSIKSEQHRASDYLTGLGIAQGFQEDIGKIVADPKTATFTLTGSTRSAVHRAVVMWDANRQAGILFCDQLPVLSNNQEYEIWATGKDGAAVQLGHFIAKPGISVYFYDAPFAGEPMYIEVTAGHRDAGNPAILANAGAAPFMSAGG